MEPAGAPVLPQVLQHLHHLCRVEARRCLIQPAPQADLVVQLACRMHGQGEGKNGQGAGRLASLVVQLACARMPPLGWRAGWRAERPVGLAWADWHGPQLWPAHRARQAARCLGRGQDPCQERSNFWSPLFTKRKQRRSMLQHPARRLGSAPGPGRARRRPGR